MKYLQLHKNHGFTLIEMIFVIAILGVLAGLAAPNFSTFIAERAVTAETRRIVSALKLARSEARTRGETVTIGRPANSDWTDTIEVYMDVTSSNNSFDPANDDLIKEISASSSSANAVDDQGNSDPWISFNSQGWLAESAPVLIAICSPALDDSAGSYISINKAGKIRQSKISNNAAGCTP